MKNHITSAMTSFGLAEQSIPLVGFRFHPTDDELFTDFLKPKMLRGLDYRPPIPEVKVCDYEPWDLPGVINLNSNDQVWYFFCPRDYKYLRSHRCNRTTKTGYWKPTGKPRKVLSKHKEVIGTKRSLVFYIRERPKPIRTKWIMHEYECALNSNMATLGSFVLCKLKSKADEVMSEGELAQMVLESDQDNQNLNEMTVNSSCDEHESIYEKGEPSCQSGFDCANQKSDEGIANYAGDEDKLCYYLGSGIGNENPDNVAAMSTYVDGKIRDFESQNPHQITDISATEEGGWSPSGPTPSASSISSNSTTTDTNAAEVDPRINYIITLEFEELAELMQEDNYNSAFYQFPMSSNESSSYSGFCSDGKGHEIGWDNEQSSILTNYAPN